jgi:hypothetical protein
MGDVTGVVEAETREEMNSSDAQLFWLGQRPGPEAPQRKLIEALSRRGLLLEPFERTLRGLTEALGDGVGGSSHADPVSG